MRIKNLHAWHTDDSNTKGINRWHLIYSIGGEEKYRTIESGLEIAWRKNVAGGFRIHLGNRGSETPVDISVSIGFLAIFWNLHFPGLGAFCEKIGRGHKRDISLRVHNGTAWWNFWYDDDMGYDDWHQCGHRRSWRCLRDGNIHLNPLTQIWGPRLYSYEDVETYSGVVNVNEYAGDWYNVDFTLQRQTRGRRRGPKWLRHMSNEGMIVAWNCEKGIPTQNHDWKGDCSYGSAVSVSMDKPWRFEAKINLAEWVKKQRDRRDYRPPTAICIYSHPNVHRVDGVRRCSDVSCAGYHLVRPDTYSQLDDHIALAND